MRLIQVSTAPEDIFPQTFFTVNEIKYLKNYKKFFMRSRCLTPAKEIGNDDEKSFCKYAEWRKKEWK